MAENEKAEAASLKRIGELIDTATNGTVKYDTYKDDQKIGQSGEKPFNGMEAAAAAIINHPEIAESVYRELDKQANLRTKAVTHDMHKELKGKTLDGLKPVVDGNGKVKDGALFMSDLPAESDVKESDKANLVKLQALLEKPEWLVAEGASNISNAIRDAEVNINGKHLTKEQEKIMRGGLKAERKLEHDLVTGKMVSEPAKSKMEGRLEKAMDTAAAAAGIATDDPIYKHYRAAMDKGIDNGLEAIKQLHAAGVGPAKGDSSMPTYAPAAKKETGPKTPQ